MPICLDGGEGGEGRKGGRRQENRQCDQFFIHTDEKLRESEGICIYDSTFYLQSFEFFTIPLLIQLLSVKLDTSHNHIYLNIHIFKQVMI